MNIQLTLKKGLSILTILFFSIGFVACNDDTGVSGRSGKLILSLNADTTFQQKVTTKAGFDELDSFTVINDYIVELLQDNKLISDYPAYEEMPDEITLPAGAYTLLAYKGENVPAAFMKPYFEGRINFAIENNMETPIEVVCQLANTRVTVDYEEDFLEAYPSYKVYLRTPLMEETDTIIIGQEETRAAYFRSDKEGTELNITLELQRLVDEETYYYEPVPIPIEPRQNVHLLFKTDGEAINGIGLTVILNNDLDGSMDLDMTIPEYTYGEVEKPTLGKERFALEVADVTYRKLQKNDDYYYLDYIVPASVAKTILKIGRTENGVTTSDEYDLAIEADAEAARQLGITISDQENKKTFSTTHNTKRGRIHFSEALAKLTPSKNAVEYSYTLYIEDALPVDPNTTETATLMVSPNAVGESVLVGSNIQDYTVMANKKLSQDIEIAFNTDAGIKTATMEVYRNDILAYTYNITSDVLPEGIAFEEDKLSFNKAFSQNLETGYFGMDEKYTFTIHATDLVHDNFKDSPLSFSVTLRPFVEITIPPEDIWGWKAQAIVTIDGLTEGNKSAISVALSEDNITFTESEDYTLIEGKAYLWVQNLIPGKTYYVKASAGSTEVTQSFTTEENAQVMFGDMNTWFLNNTKCTFLGVVPKYMPFPVLSNTGSATYWKTNNSVTAGQTFSDISSANLPIGCFPTVVYEGRDVANQFAAVIRSIDASAKNQKARGELVYENNHASRPSSVSFEYTYDAFGNETFISDIIVYSGDVIIGTGTRPASAGAESTYTTCIVPITYTETTQKATAIKLFFASSDNESGFGTTSGQKISAPKASADSSAASYPGSFENFSNVNAGSTLKIDNVTLNYAE